ncbi:hypothetical protein [Aeromicrobium sp.]|uniref:hypothetical protein n=1 Tax=Aeromicrobium sp. TaxID=1871063 RepID=UPI003C34E653
MSIIVSTVPVLVTGTIWSTLAGLGAARLLSAELVARRRAWSLERTGMVQDNRQLSVARSREHIEFAERMGSSLRLRDAQLATLRDSLVTAEIELARARERMSQERARSAALQADVESAQTDLESARLDLRHASDALAASESAELLARAEVLAWQESADQAARLQDRKLA